MTPDQLNRVTASVKADLDEQAVELLAKRYKHARPGAAQLMPWGTRDLTIQDPSGNRITFFSSPPSA